MERYYRKYKFRDISEIQKEIETIQESLGGPIGLEGPGEINGVPIEDTLRINIPIFLTQNIEDLGIYEDVGETKLELKLGEIDKKINVKLL